MVDENEINQGGGNNADIIDVINYTAPRRRWTLRNQVEKYLGPCVMSD
jgi:hypothetical protein